MASLSVKKTILPHTTETFSFFLTWCFPNRKAWSETVIGNYYCTKFKDAWAARSSFLEAIMEETKLLDECDVVVPVNKIAGYLAFVNKTGEECGLEIKSFGHAGDGNLHIYQCSNDLTEEEFKKRVDKFFDIIYKEATACGGLVSGEHGIGMGKVKYLVESVGERNMEIMEGIKRVFDPKMILNPGKVCYRL